MLNEKSVNPPVLPSDEVFKKAYATMDFVSLTNLSVLYRHHLELIDQAICSIIADNLSKMLDNMFSSDPEDLL